jgi:GWxTD domain-containing protein
MRTTRHLIFIATFLAVSLPLLGNPGQAIGTARAALKNQQYDVAIQTLQDAVPQAAELAEPQRSQALAAIHFYTAMAFSAMKNDVKTHEELEQFFHFSPNMNKIDPAKYEADFVRAFNEVAAGLKKEDSSNFDSVYPGYRTFSAEEPGQRPLERWGEGPDLILLGTAADKAAWRQLRDDDQRRSFIDEFWQRRDKNRDTAENEVRREFLHRVAFADQTWTTEQTRGSMTDRGRVFVLFGPPRVIRQKPLSAREGATTIRSRPTAVVRATETAPGAAAASRTASAIEAANRNLTSRSLLPAPQGKVERWIYGRDQLPRTIPDTELVFKFISEEGYGDHVLQREYLVTKALHDAAMMYQ